MQYKFYDNLKMDKSVKFIQRVGRSKMMFHQKKKADIFLKISKNILQRV